MNNIAARNAAVANQVRYIRAQKQLSYYQSRIAQAIAARWDGELANHVVVAAAIDLDAQGPQWVLKINRGYFLDIVREAIDKASAAAA